MSAPVRVSRLAYFSWRDGQLICDLPHRHRQLALTEAAEHLLRVFADWAGVDDAVGMPGGPALARQLLDAGVLVARYSPEDTFESELGPWAEMGPAARYFHLASRTHSDARFLSAGEDTHNLIDKARHTLPPPAYRSYPGSARTALPQPELPEAGLAEVLRRRRTTRSFDARQPISAGLLGTLLRWAAGPVHTVDIPWLGQVPLKTSPSAGARHPIEVYPVVRDVAGVAPGIYHYDAAGHALERLPGDAPSPETLAHWCGGQPYAATASVLLIYTSVLGRTTWKYPSARSYRTVMLDAGHLSQTVYLLATALELGVFFTAATRDAEIEAALGLRWNEEILLGLSGIGAMTAGEQRRQREMEAGGTPGFSVSHTAWEQRPEDRG